MVGASVCAVSIVLVVILLPETLSKSRSGKRAHDSAKGLRNPKDVQRGEDRKLISDRDAGSVAIVATDDEDDEDDDDDDDDDGNDVEVAVVKRANASPSSGASQGDKDGGAFSRMCQVLKTRDLLICTALYAILGMLGIVIDEIFPLWVLTPPRSGGFNFTSSDIGSFAFRDI